MSETRSRPKNPRHARSRRRSSFLSDQKPTRRRRAPLNKWYSQNISDRKRGKDLPFKETYTGFLDQVWELETKTWIHITLAAVGRVEERKGTPVLWDSTIHRSGAQGGSWKVRAPTKLICSRVSCGTMLENKESEMRKTEIDATMSDA